MIVNWLADHNNDKYDTLINERWCLCVEINGKFTKKISEYRIDQKI